MFKDRGICNILPQDVVATLNSIGFIEGIRGLSKVRIYVILLHLNVVARLNSKAI